MENLQHYLKSCSDNIDTIIDKDKLDENYKTKKSIFLASYYKLMSTLFKCSKDKKVKRGKGLPDNDMLEKVLGKFASKKNSLAEISLKASLKQLDCPPNGPLNDGHGEGKKGAKNRRPNRNPNGRGRNRRSEEEIHNNNIIDNIMFLIPMYTMCDAQHSKHIIQSINYSNSIESTNHKSELLLTMYEKYEKSGSKVDSKKFKKYMTVYDTCVQALSKYL